MKILSVGGDLFHADRRTNMKKLVAGFRNFANASQKPLQSHEIYIFRYKCKFNKIRIKSKPSGGRRAALSHRDSKLLGAPHLCISIVDLLLHTS